MLRNPIFLVLSLLVSNTGHAIEVLVPGHLHCLHESDLVELVDTTDYDILSKTLASKLDNLRCVIVPVGMTVKDVYRKITKNGGSYVCYRDDNDLRASSPAYCALDSQLMSLDQYLDSRSSDYKIVGEGMVSGMVRIVAKCVDGSTVLLEEYSGYFLRTVHLPFAGLDYPPPTRVGSEIDSAFRAGCRGEDYKRVR